MSAARDGTRRRICVMCACVWKPKSARNYKCPKCGAWDDELYKRIYGHSQHRVPPKATAKR